MEITIEGDTLVDKIETIKGSIYHDEESKKRLAGEILDEAREEHWLVDEAARGKRSIPDTAEELLRPYKGLRILLPIFRGRGHNKRLEKYNLHKLIDSYMLQPTSQMSYLDRALYWVMDKCMNPVGLGLSVLLYKEWSNTLVRMGQEGFERGIENFIITGMLMFPVVFAGLAFGSYLKYRGVQEVRKKARDLHAIVHEPNRIF